MPIRDDVVFGPGKSTPQLTFDDVRKLSPNEQSEALKRRLDVFLVFQVGELGKEETGQAKVYAPFPLFLLTCVAIETLGKVFFRPKESKGDDEDQWSGFLEVCKRMDPLFSRPLNSGQKQQYDQLWGKDEHRKVDSCARILYRSGRNTIIHGFRGRGVYLTEDEEVPRWRMNQGAIELHPYWFWRSFKETYDATWEEAFRERESNGPRRRSSGKYLAELLA